MGISLRHLFFIVLTLFLSSIFVFHAAAAAKKETHQAPNQELGIAYEDREPIHVGAGFNFPQSLEKPLRILLPTLSLDVPIVDAPIIDGHWQVAEKVANHGVGSAYPGQKGNMVIFAHAKKGLFLNLQHIAEHDELYVLTNKKWYAYKVTKITEVTPDQVEVIAPTPDEQVTLFTCSGFADEKRLIVVGKRMESTFDLDESFMNLLE